MKTKPRKAKTTRRIKARRMYACYMGQALYKIEPTLEDAAYHLCDTPAFMRDKRDRVAPVAVIDVSDEDALILQADEAILHCGDWSFQNTPLPMEMARAVLKSLGIIKKLPATKTTDGS